MCFPSSFMLRTHEKYTAGVNTPRNVLLAMQMQYFLYFRESLIAGPILHSPVMLFLYNNDRTRVETSVAPDLCAKLRFPSQQTVLTVSLSSTFLGQKY